MLDPLAMQTNQNRERFARALLFAACLLVCGAALVVLTPWLVSWRTQAGAVRTLRQNRAMVEYAYLTIRSTKTGRHAYKEDQRALPGPAWVRAMLGDDATADVRQVLFIQPVHDNNLLPLGDLPGLETVVICDSQLTAAGYARLQALPNLRILTIDGPTVTPAELRKLQAALPNCDVN